MIIAAETPNDTLLTRRHGVYMYDNQLMNEQEYKSFLKINCPDAYKEFNLGQNCVIAGWTLFSVCIPSTIIATFGWLSHMGWGTPPDRRETEEYKRMMRQGMTSLSFIPISFAGFAASIPLLSVGYHKKHHSVDTFNGKCPQADISMQVSENGLGVAVTF